MSLLSKLKEQRAEQMLSRPEIKPSDVHIPQNIGVRREFERSEKAQEVAEAKALGKDATEARAHFHDALEETLAGIAKDLAQSDIVLDPSQLRALNGSLKNKVCCLIGAAGTGKTTLTRIIIGQLMKKYQVTIVNDETGEKTKKIGIRGGSFTGRASQQFKRALPEEWHSIVSTIHSLLGYAPTMEERAYTDPITGITGWKEIRVFRPTYNAACKLPFQLYILDEASMIPIYLFNELVDAIHPTSRIIVIGDIHQLPPVMGKGILGYCLQKWPTFELTEIHRQAAGNAIITNAHRILKGQMVSKAANFHLLNSMKGNSLEMQTYVRGVMMKMKEMGRYDPFRDAIITPWNVGPLGTIELNEYFMTMFNPEKKDEKTNVVLNKRIRIHTGTGTAEYALGDKVMILNNINTCDPPITNGMMGIVESINRNGKYDLKRSQIEDDDDEAFSEGDFTLDTDDFTLDEVSKIEKVEEAPETLDQRQSSHVMTIRFETGATYECSTAGDYRKITFGYVITCHKSQGGEYPNVFIVVHSANIKMLSQEWFYTAVTRARANVYVIYNERGLKKAIQTQRIKGHTLKEKIASYIIDAKADDFGNIDPFNVDRAKFPILFEPETVE